MKARPARQCRATRRAARRPLKMRRRKLEPRKASAQNRQRTNSRRAATGGCRVLGPPIGRPAPHVPSHPASYSSGAASHEARCDGGRRCLELAAGPGEPVSRAVVLGQCRWLAGLRMNTLARRSGGRRARAQNVPALSRFLATVAAIVPSRQRCRHWDHPGTRAALMSCTLATCRNVQLKGTRWPRFMKSVCSTI